MGLPRRLHGAASDAEDAVGPSTRKRPPHDTDGDRREALIQSDSGSVDLNKRVGTNDY